MRPTSQTIVGRAASRVRSCAFTLAAASVAMVSCAHDALIVQMEHPKGCAPGTQPAIVGFDTHGRAMVPTWKCLPACPAGQEYVSETPSGEPGYDEWRNTYVADPDHETVVEAVCRKQCGPDEERRTYLRRGTLGCNLDLAGECVPKDYDRHDRHANGC